MEHWLQLSKKRQVSNVYTRHPHVCVPTATWVGGASSSTAAGVVLCSLQEAGNGCDGKLPIVAPFQTFPPVDQLMWAARF